MGAERMEVQVECPQCEGLHRQIGPCLCSMNGVQVGRIPARLVDPEAVLRDLLLARLREIAARPDADLRKSEICDAVDGWYLLREDRDNAGLIVSLLAPASPEEGTDAK